MTIEKTHCGKWTHTESVCENPESTRGQATQASGHLETEYASTVLHPAGLTEQWGAADWPPVALAFWHAASVRALRGRGEEQSERLDVDDSDRLVEARGPHTVTGQSRVDKGR